MSRDQRTRDNWALLFSQELSQQEKVPLSVVFCLVPQFLEATFRQYAFMIRGLAEVEQTLAKKHIPFHLLVGSPEVELPGFLRKNETSGLVTDFDPLRLKRKWKGSGKRRWWEDWTSRSLRWMLITSSLAGWLRINKNMGLIPYVLRFGAPCRNLWMSSPPLQKQAGVWKGPSASIDWQGILAGLGVDRTVPEANRFKPGEKTAWELLEDFLENKLPLYPERRNDPTLEGQSNLSPYLHFGQISAQRIALEVEDSPAGPKAKEAFLEELIVRRELAHNFCFYNLHYDSFAGFPSWAQKTLDEHRHDHREYLYTLAQFEQAHTHDDLWNAAQQEMGQTGKLHGFMRMYWAKKILEWTRSPEEALKVAIYLNDRYELDIGK